VATGSILHMHRGQIGSASGADLSITLSLQQNKHVPASPQMVPPILNCHFQAKPTWMAGPEAPAISLGRSSDAFHLPARCGWVGRICHFQFALRPRFPRALTLLLRLRRRPRLPTPYVGASVALPQRDCQGRGAGATGGAGGVETGARVVWPEVVAGGLDAVMPPR
jgi:hypothetical protein